MKQKQIIIDYEEYLELLNRIKTIEDLLSQLYENVTREQQKEISDYMRKYSNWI